MPYVIDRNEKGEHCIYKQDADGKRTGNSMGCHPSKSAAQRQLKALYTNEPEARNVREAKRKNKQAEAGLADELYPDDGKKPSREHDEVFDMPIAKPELVEVTWKKNLPSYKENGDLEAYATPVAARSFADLAAMEAAQCAAEKVHQLASQFTTLVFGIMNDPGTNDKAGAIRGIADEFVALIDEVMGAAPKSPAGELPEDAIIRVVPKESAITEADGEVLCESESGQAVQIAEDNQLEPTDKRAPLKLDLRLITPGWGNKKDMHYYPADVLKRDAHVFEGAKMYVTDHRPGEKSERTEVSVIESIVRFADDGAPIARVAVFDPEFAEKTRNRAALGQLGTLECSILASGKTRKGKQDGIEGNIVEAITARQSVDWVTKAGAGGQAIALAESNDGSEGGKPVELENKPDEVKVEAAPIAPEPEKKPDDKPEDKLEDKPESAAAQSVGESAIVETLLSEAEVTDELKKRPGLPAALKSRIAGASYKTADELKEALDREVEYYKAISGSGKPVALGGATLAEAKQASAEEREKIARERFNRVMREVGAKEV